MLATGLGLLNELDPLCGGGVVVPAGPRGVVGGKSRDAEQHDDQSKIRMTYPRKRSRDAWSFNTSAGGAIKRRFSC